MRKHIPKANFYYEGYLTTFSTMDKDLAKIIFTYLADTVTDIVEELQVKDCETYEYSDTETTVSTGDKGLAILVYEYGEKNSHSRMQSTIKKLKEEIED